MLSFKPGRCHWHVTRKTARSDSLSCGSRIFRACHPSYDRPSIQVVSTSFDPGEAKVTALTGAEAPSLLRKRYETVPLPPTAEIRPLNRRVTGQGPA
jgi:hypothetical protein